MYQALLVSVLQTEGGLTHQGAGVIDRQGSVLSHQGIEGDTLDELHDEEVQPFRLVGVEGHHDVGMDQVRAGAHFAAEPLDGDRIATPTPAR